MVLRLKPFSLLADRVRVILGVRGVDGVLDVSTIVPRRLMEGFVSGSTADGVTAVADAALAGCLNFGIFLKRFASLFLVAGDKVELVAWAFKLACWAVAGTLLPSGSLLPAVSLSPAKGGLIFIVPELRSTSIMSPL